MTFDPGTWLTRRGKNRLAVLAILASAGLCTAAALRFDIEWLLALLPIHAVLLKPLLIAQEPGPVFVHLINVLLPGYINLTEIETRKAELREVVEGFAAMVDEYGLGTKGVDLRAALLAHPPAAKTAQQRLEYCVREFLELMSLSGASRAYLTEPLLTLLYSVHTGARDSRTAWWSYKKEPAALDRLVKALNDSKRLPETGASSGDLARLLAPFEDFDFDTFRDELRVLERIWRVSERWGRFLGENGLSVAGLSFTAVLDRIAKGPGLPCRPQEVKELEGSARPILRWIGEESFKGKGHAMVEENERQIHLLIALGEFLTQVVPQEPAIKDTIPGSAWVKDVCGELDARSRGTYAILLAYLDLLTALAAAPAGPEPRVSIDRLIRDRGPLYERRTKGPAAILAADIARIHDRLNQGIFPPYLTDLELCKAQIEEVVEAFAAMVDEYGLGVANLRAALLEHPPATTTEEQRLDYCVGEFLALSRASHPRLTAPLLELLYREREHTKKSATRAAWSAYKKDPAAMALLVDVLTGSGKLPASSADPGQIELILQPHEEFAVDTVGDEINALERIWRVSERWARFLDAENGLPVAGLSFAALLGRIEVERKRAGKKGLPGRPKEVKELADSALPILRWIGEESIAGKYPAMAGEERRIHLLIALAVFLTKVVRKEAIKDTIPDPDWLRDICGELYARADSYAIVFAYLDLREDLKKNPSGKGPYVSIDQLISGWRARKAHGPMPIEEILESIRCQLYKGEFPPNLLPVNTPQGLASMTRDYQNLIQLAEQRKAILQTLRCTFQELTISTVERFLEARGTDAYLLTFSTLRGNLAELIDCLADTDLPRRLGSRGSALSGAGYNFKHYTNSARIGILPQGWPFEHFATILQRDLSVLLASYGTLFPGESVPEGIEVLVHRFNLSESDYFEVRHELVRRRAVQEVRALLGETLPPEQLVALVAYDGKVNLVDAILAGPIADLTGDEMAYTDAERKALELRDPALRYGLVLAHRAGSVQELARRLAAPEAADERQKAAEVLAALFAEQVPALDGGRRAQAAESYVRTLAAVASIGRQCSAYRPMPAAA